MDPHTDPLCSSPVVELMSDDEKWIVGELVHSGPWHSHPVIRVRLSQEAYEINRRDVRMNVTPGSGEETIYGRLMAWIIPIEDGVETELVPIYVTTDFPKPYVWKGK